MKLKCAFAAAVSCYVICTASLLLVLYVDFLGDYLNKISKIVFTVLIFVSAYAGSYFRCRISADEAGTVMRKTTVFLFAVYAAVIVDFTLIDGTFGRNASCILKMSLQEISYYLKNNVNVIPFATIKLFLKGYKNGNVYFSEMLENLLGNFLVMMPLAFFIPIVFKRQFKFLQFVLIITATVCVIEMLQIFFVAGAADVDDLILNLSGAICARLFLENKKISRLVSVYTFGLWGESDEFSLNKGACKNKSDA